MSGFRKDNIICDHSNSKEINQFETVNLYRCNECKIIFSDKYREDFDPSILYEKYYKNEVAARFGFGFEHIIRLFRFFRAFKISVTAPQAKRILDIGSGRGFTLYYLKKYYKFLRTAGTQISENAFNFSRNKLGLEIYNKDLLELPLSNASFDLITIWHVLEHVNKPEHYIEKIYDLLDSHGKLIIEVPNFDSWSRVFTAKYWLSYDLKHHLFFFTRETLSALLIKHGFKIKHVHTFSLEYSAFTSAQSIVSAFTRSNSTFFREIQKGKLNYLIVIHAFLIIFITPLCLIINILLYFSKRGEVLFIVADKQ